MSEYDLTKAQPKSFIAHCSAKELHALIDTVPDAIVIADEKGTIRSFSKGAEEMFGYSEDPILGENVSALMQSSKNRDNGDLLHRDAETGATKSLSRGRVTTARHQDGSTFPIKISIGALDFGDLRGFVIYMRDLTEKREKEREIHTLQGELAHVARIWSMGSLATSLAHELNQPLTAVANYAHSARDLLDDASPGNLALVRQAMDECATEALRAGAIVHRLRDFIRHGETERQVVSLKQIIQEAAALALLNGDGKGVDFDTDFDPAAERVLVDPVQLQQVVLNLFRNALEAMHDCQRRQLHVRTHRTSDRFALISVIDSGPGLDQNIADRLFHPFNSSKQDGLGLGLSICNSIVRSQDGKIWTEPSDLGGTAFHFTVPLAETDDDPS